MLNETSLKIQTGTKISCARNTIKGMKAVNWWWHSVRSGVNGIKIKKERGSMKSTFPSFILVVIICLRCCMMLMSRSHSSCSLISCLDAFTCRHGGNMQVMPSEPTPGMRGGWAGQLPLPKCNLIHHHSNSGCKAYQANDEAIYIILYIIFVLQHMHTFLICCCNPSPR